MMPYSVWAKKRVIIGVIVALVLSLSGLVLYETHKDEMPVLNIGQISTVMSSDGKVLGAISGAQRVNEQLQANDISSLLRQAHMAAEDRSFYDHGALSIFGIGGAIASNVRHFSLAAGGSTITQQYVKNAYLTNDRSFKRKFKEFIYSYRLENLMGKDQILVNYINTNNYGRGAFGIEEASQAWFGHSASQIKNPNDPTQVAKAAFLAALVQQPSYFDDTVKGKSDQLAHADALVTRQRYVLNGLREVEGYDPSSMVTRETIEAAKKLLPLKVKKDTGVSRAKVDTFDPYILDYVKKWMRDWNEHALAEGGLTIETTIDYNLHRLLIQAAESELPHKDTITAGGVILDPRNGALLAMYGGTNYSKSQYNNALYANRLPGSAMKPIVLADAVRNGISLQSKFAAPASIQPQGSKKPIWNTDKQPAKNCKATLADATAFSINTPFIELILGKMASCSDPSKLTPIEPNYPVSPRTVARLARQMGAEDSLMPGKKSRVKFHEDAGLAIGQTELTPLKMASIYATLANHGMHTKPFIIDEIARSNRSIIYRNKPESERVLEPLHADLVVRALTRVMTEGTAKEYQVPGRKTAAKTGTTDVGDGRIIEITPVDTKTNAPAYVCSVWGALMKPGTTAELWGKDMGGVCKYFLTSALNGTATGTIKAKPWVDFAPVDMNTGRLIGLN